MGFFGTNGRSNLFVTDCVLAAEADPLSFACSAMLIWFGAEFSANSMLEDKIEELGFIGDSRSWPKAYCCVVRERNAVRTMIKFSSDIKRYRRVKEHNLKSKMDVLCKKLIPSDWRVEWKRFWCWRWPFTIHLPHCKPRVYTLTSPQWFSCLIRFRPTVFSATRAFQTCWCWTRFGYR